ncbi:DUF4030 domain-containing protein [Bacillus sp. 123MFChir2]|uniref:DUF4030 domain-containing protein n=1 Tax=Bacillus sp. 123MFChir2 TaxID=1169144 RepID=UPI0003763D7F|nr:DUF4030 domain-containing protein [Bacillus sp. 123MFChir2]
MKIKIGVFGLILPIVLLCSCQQTDTENSSEDSKVMDTVLLVVDKESFIGASIDEKDKVVDLEIADVENASKVRSKINEQLEKQGIQPRTIHINQKNMAQVKQEHRWDEIQSSLFNELFKSKGYKEFTLQQISMSSNQPITLGVHTPVKNSDVEAHAYAKKVENDIKEFLSTEKLKSWVKADSYMIKVYNQDKQVIN